MACPSMVLKRCSSQAAESTGLGCRRHFFGACDVPSLKGISGITCYSNQQITPRSSQHHLNALRARQHAAAVTPPDSRHRLHPPSLPFQPLRSRTRRRAACAGPCAIISPLLFAATRTHGLDGFSPQFRGTAATITILEDATNHGIFCLFISS
jgi:hypothetical protein